MLQKIETIYEAKELDKIKIKEGCWEHLRVGVYSYERSYDETKKAYIKLQDTEKQVGEYIRNYPSLRDTFFPFKKSDKWYALYSREYMYTRLMSLPDCEDIGGEDKSNTEYQDHFCPSEFYIPKGSVRRGKEAEGQAVSEKGLKMVYADTGFIHGCVWGGPYRVAAVDLSKVEVGIIKRDFRFGYVQIPDHLTLRACIDFNPYLDLLSEEEYNKAEVNICVPITFDSISGKILEKGFC